MILCYARSTASAVPFHGMGMTSPLSGDAWACAKRWGASSRWEDTDDIMHMYLPGQRREGIGRRSGGRMILEDVLQRMRLKLAYRRL
jgi:hypothetical protein